MSARLTRAQADLTELKLRVRSGELVSRQAVEGEWFKITRALRDNYQNLPSRSAGSVAAERDQHRCNEILSAEVHQILEGLTHGVQDTDHQDSRANARPVRR